MYVLESCGLSSSAGGLFYAVSSLCKAVLSEGCRVEVCGRTDPYLKDDIGRWAPVKVSTYKAYGPLQSSLKFRKMLRQMMPDVVHQHGIWLDDQWSTLNWQKKTGRPVVISPHGMLDPWAVNNANWKKKLVGKLFANESLGNANIIHALCRAEAEAIRSYGLSNPIAVIPNGVELPDERACLRNEGFHGRKRLLFLGRLHAKKGMEPLLRAWRGLEDHSQWQLVIAGWDDGGYLPSLNALTKELGLTVSRDIEDEASVCFFGPAFDLEKDALMRSASAFILPSFSEGLPVSVLEAWSYGLPVIMTGFCNLPEGFHAGAAVCVEPTAGSIRNGIQQFFEMSVSEMNSMGQKGRQLVEEKFVWSKIAQAMENVYECAVSGEVPKAVY